MGRHRHTREGHESLCIRVFPKGYIILTHYMFSAWWLHLLDGLGHYVILPGSIAYILMITNNIMKFGYTYANYRLMKPPHNFSQITHIIRLIVWIPSRSS